MSADSTRYPQATPPMAIDTFTRLQVVQYLDAIPLGYLSDRDHEVLEAFVTRAQRHFAALDAAWQPSND